jgi:hypothetical protein
MFTLQTFWLDTKTSEDDEVVSWSLSSPADLQGLVIPTRQITSLCEWALRGQYRSGDGCTYNGTAYFDAKGNRSLTRRWMYAVVASVTAVNDLAPAWQSLTRQFSILAASRQPFFLPITGHPMNKTIWQLSARMRWRNPRASAAASLFSLAVASATFRTEYPRKSDRAFPHRW